MCGVVVNGGQLGKVQRVADSGQLLAGFGVPVRFQLRIAGREVGRQRRVHHHLHVTPGHTGTGHTLTVAVDGLCGRC